MKSGLSREEERRFGEFRLDLRQSALFRGETEIKLRPKAFDALVHFVAHPDRLIPKQELIETLWPGMTAVSEDSLAHCVMEVRRALGDSKQSMLRTVTGRGYIFSAPLVATEEIAEPPRPRRVVTLPASLRWGAALLGVLVLAFFAWRESERQKHLARIPEIESLAAQGEFVKAFRLAQQVLEHKPDETRILRLWNQMADTLSVKTDPAGAEVFLHVQGEAEAKRLGQTPLEAVAIPRGAHVLTLRKAGFATLERSISSSVARSRPREETPWDLRVEAKFLPAEKLPPGMVHVPEAKHYPMRMLRAVSPMPQDLPAYFIDRHEVSHQDFLAFVQSGEFAKHSTRQDRSGLPGLASWSGGKPAPEQLSLPVTGVNWKEARAYCQWRGKDLPTLYQWQAAARSRYYTPFGNIYPWGVFQANEVAQRANLRGAGPWPVGSQPFGMSHVGAYDMAGNVREWLRNEREPGRAIGGGSWRDDVYQFLVQGAAEESRVADDLGFRCALGDDPAGAVRVEEAPVSQIPPPVSEARFAQLREQYRYDPRALDAQVVARKEGPTWWREEIRFRGAAGEMAYAYLYLPKNAQPPYQTIQLLGGYGYFVGVDLTELVEGRQVKMEPFITAGRALFLVGLKGFRGREPVGEISNAPLGSQRYRQLLREWVEDLRRGLDYLQSRPDIDGQRVAFWNSSTTEIGVVNAALEDRYAAVVLCGAGFEPFSLQIAQDMNPGIFTPFIRAPKFQLHGKYDEQNPIRTMGRPVFDALRGDKIWQQFDGGHIAPPEVEVPAISPWLDAKLGPVKLRNASGLAARR